MNGKRIFRIRFVIVILLGCSWLYAEEPESIQLPKPEMYGGKPLMEVLKERSSHREFDEKMLPPQTLSNLLWASWGVNRQDSGKRTAPSGRNLKDIDIYVVTGDGAYLYNAQQHILEKITSEDIRALTGRQAAAQSAPVNLVYVSDYSRMGNISEEEKDFLSAADTGFISQNTYLFCASEGLATFVYHGIYRLALAEKLGLHKRQTITLAQAVGYKK